jgi:hypothetical protein
LQGTGLPFNKYSWLTTHNSFAVTGTPSATGAPIVSPPNQEDSVASQLSNGVRGLMLDIYDFKNDLWLCHSFAGKCYDFTAYVRNQIPPTRSQLALSMSRHCIYANHRPHAC